jgi:hypothetical protein
VSVAGRTRRSPLAGAEPLSPRLKWRAILIATLALVPAYWTLLAGMVSEATGGSGEVAPPGAPYIAFGLAVIPFVFVALAFFSEHPRWPGAVIRAMGLSLLVGIPVSALAADVVTGFVAGIGAGGIAALRMDLQHTWKSRALAILVVTAFTYVALRTIGAAAIVLAPILPFTSLGVADHLTERDAPPADPLA